jgi:uncharacterized protein (TIGR03437 family)
MVWKFVCLLALAAAHAAAQTPAAACAESRSVTTFCAEQDNINIPLSGGVHEFAIEATHPTYEIGTDNCEPDFTNCPNGSGGQVTLERTNIFDDHVTVVQLVHDPAWWRQKSMAVSVDGGGPLGATSVVLYRHIEGTDEYPQFFVMYQDANIRLIPQPPAGVASVCFGASLLLGPAPAAERPFADVASIHYQSNTQTLEIVYEAGGSATIQIGEVSRRRARLAVTLNFPETSVPFSTFRSMFVTAGNADTDAVRWRDRAGRLHDGPVTDFRGGGGREWFFYRRAASQHNRSAPDIRVTMSISSPLVYAGGVANAASLANAPVAAGQAVRILGCGIGPQDGAIADYPVPALGGARALFDGDPATLWYAQGEAVVALVPLSVFGKSAANLEIEYGGQRSPAVSLPVAATAPGIFTLDGSAAAALNQDGSLNSAATPASRGAELMFFATGAPVPVTVEIGGASATVTRREVLGGNSGVLAVTVRVPQAAPPGAASLVLSCGGRSSQAGVTIAVR